MYCVGLPTVDNNKGFEIKIISVFTPYFILQYNFILQIKFMVMPLGSRRKYKYRLYVVVLGKVKLSQLLYLLQIVFIRSRGASDEVVTLILEGSDSV